MGSKKERSKKKRLKSPIPTEQAIVLDRFSALDVRRAAEYRDKYLKFYWDYYSVLAHQRAKIRDKIQKALSESTNSPYAIDRWQRAIRWKYSNHPLCTRGSVVEPGGRFNIPDIDSNKFPIFPALYVAEDKETAILEMFLQDAEFEGKAFSKLDFALAKETSFSCIQISAKLEAVLDLTNPDCLAGFVELMKDFEIPPSLSRIAKELQLGHPVGVVRSVDDLVKTLLDPNWRFNSMQQDIPANSQIFGQIVLSAGIEGIVYPSKMNGKKCLAVFIQNFEKSSSYVEVVDAPPSADTPVRIDATTWRKFL